MELARVQPVHQTTFAGIDDDVPRSSVEMTDHWLPARRTVEESVARILAARRGAAKRARFRAAHGLDDRDKAVHVDQHAETARTAEQRMTLQPAVRKVRRTDRAQRRCLAQQLQSLNQSRQLLLTAAVVAHEKAPAAIDPHGCPTVVAVCHHGIIGEGERGD